MLCTIPAEGCGERGKLENSGHEAEDLGSNCKRKVEGFLGLIGERTSCVL